MHSTVKIISITRIINPNNPDFDKKHKAFTGLGESKGKYYLAFRQGESHVSDRKQLVSEEIFVSKDGHSWKPLQSFTEASKGSWYYDYRNGYFCNHNGKLFLYAFISWAKGKQRKYWAQVQTLEANGKFTAPQRINIREVMWAPVSYNGKVYAAAWDGGETYLWESADGIDFTRKARIETGTEECSIFPSKNGTLEFVLRREPEGRQVNSLTLRSLPPYDKVKITQSLDEILHCPIAFACGDERYVAARQFGPPEPVKIFRLEDDGNVKEVLTLPSRGDSAYCGVVPLGGRRFMVSYYSQHDNAQDGLPSSDVYVAEIEL